VITCDEDVLVGGRRRDPIFRPGPSPDLLLSSDLAGGALCVHRESALSAAGQVHPSAARYGLLLRLAGADARDQAHAPLVLLHRRPALPASDRQARLQEAEGAAAERGIRLEADDQGRRRPRLGLRGEPSVEIIVPFRDRPELLECCVRSVLGASTYERLSLRLVDNGSVAASTAELLGRLVADARVTLSGDPRPFNFAALNNAAVAASEAEFVVFLNSDTEVLTPTWLEDMLEEAQRPEVGAVAPLLLYPDGTVQHVGAAIGMHGYAGHPFAGLAPDTETPFGTATSGIRNWLAVTAACMMVERRKFQAVGGFDASFVVAGNDVDLCLRLLAAGHRSLCLPHVRLLHDESSSRGAHIDPADFGRSEVSYGEFRTVGDPFYNPNLTLALTDCGPRRPEEL
jgi:GT2 family glycosyltransferase